MERRAAAGCETCERDASAPPARKEEDAPVPKPDPCEASKVRKLDGPQVLEKPKGKDEDRRNGAQEAAAERDGSCGLICFQGSVDERSRKSGIPFGQEPRGAELPNGGSNGSASGEASTSYEKSKTTRLGGTNGLVKKEVGTGGGRTSGNGCAHGSLYADCTAKAVNGTSGGGSARMHVDEKEERLQNKKQMLEKKGSADRAGGLPMDVNVSLLTGARNRDEGERNAQVNRSSSDTCKGTTSSGFATRGNADTTGTEQDTSDMAKPGRPTEPLACPRCKSSDTKFCYYNNYNVRQPRHFCRSCQRYWTAGGTLRNVPVGAGRRKNKSSSSGQATTTGYDSSGAQSIRGPTSSGLPRFPGTNAPLAAGHYPLHAQSYMAQGACPPTGMLQSHSDVHNKTHCQTAQVEKARSKSNSPGTEDGTHLSLGKKTDNSLGSNATAVGRPGQAGTSTAHQPSREARTNLVENPGVFANAFPFPRGDESAERQNGCAVAQGAAGPNPWMHGMNPMTAWGNKPPEAVQQSGVNGPQQSQHTMQAWMAQMSGCMWPGAGYFPYGWMQGPQTPGWNAAMAASAAGWPPVPLPNQTQLAYPQHMFPPSMAIVPSSEKGGIAHQEMDGSMQWGNHWMSMWQGGQAMLPENRAGAPVVKTVAAQPGMHQKNSGRERREGGASMTLGKHSRSAETLH